MMFTTTNEIVKEFIKIRHEAGLTQSDLSKKMKTTQSRISYFETCRDNPSITWLDRYARSCGKKLHITFESEE